MPDLTLDEQLDAAQAAWAAAVDTYDQTVAAALGAKAEAAAAFRAAYEAVQAEQRLAVEGETIPEQRIVLADTFGAADTTDSGTEPGVPPSGPPLWGPPT